MKTLVLTAADVKQVLDMDVALDACERAFGESGLGRTVMPPKVYLDLDQYDGDFRAMPGYVPEVAGLKWVSVHLRNVDRGLPTVMAIIVYNDATTGFPLAILDGTEITNYRTGAAGGIAAKYLARPDAKTLGLVGSGAQAQTQLAAISRLFELERTLVWSCSPGSARAFAERNRAFGVKAAPLPEVAACDIVCTTTPSRTPLVEKGWLRPGAHVNAIGADALGKQELDPAILAASKVIVDDLAQAIHSGEVNVPIRSGVYLKEQVYGMIGEVVAGIKPGRATPEEITIFDSTGLAIQDIATARAVYDKARREGLGMEIDLVGANPRA